MADAPVAGPSACLATQDGIVAISAFAFGPAAGACSGSWVEPNSAWIDRGRDPEVPSRELLAQLPSGSPPCLEARAGFPCLERGRVGPLGDRREDRWLVVRPEQSRHPEAGNVATRRCQPGGPALDELILLARCTCHRPEAQFDPSIAVSFQSFIVAIVRDPISNRRDLLGRQDQR